MNIGVITTSRADFGIYLPLLRKIRERNHEFFLFVGGMHTSADFGNSYLLIEKEKHQVMASLALSLINHVYFQQPDGDITMKNIPDDFNYDKFDKKLDKEFGKFLDTCNTVPTTSQQLHQQ